MALKPPEAPKPKRKLGVLTRVIQSKNKILYVIITTDKCTIVGHSKDLSNDFIPTLGSFVSFEDGIYKDKATAKKIENATVDADYTNLVNFLNNDDVTIKGPSKIAMFSLSELISMVINDPKYKITNGITEHYNYFTNAGYSYLGRYEEAYCFLLRDTA